MIIKGSERFSDEEMQSFVGREGTFELWYDKTSFPFTIKKILEFKQDDQTEQRSIILETDQGAQIEVSFMKLGEHGLEIVEIPSLSSDTVLLKALVVDDEESVVDVLERILLSLGIEDISLAFNGETAIMAYKITNPDIIFCDFQMPEMNGLELLAKLRSLEFKGKFVLISGYYADVVEIAKEEEHQPDFIFPKPFRRSDVLNVLKASFPDLIK